MCSVFLTARSTSTSHGTSRQRETLSGGERLGRGDDSRMITLLLIDGGTLSERILLRNPVRGKIIASGLVSKEYDSR